MSKSFLVKRALIASAVTAAFALPVAADPARSGATSGGHGQAMTSAQQAHAQGDIRSANQSRIHARDDVRLSQLIGKKIRNSQGEKLGKVKDVVVDLKNKKVEYAVIEREGDSERLIALPSRALKTGASEHLILDVDRDTLAGIRGFESDRLPGISDGNYWQDVQRRLGDIAALDSSQQTTMRRGSELLKTDVVSRAGENLGEVRDVVINLDNGSVHYAVLDFEDNAWLPDQLAALPLDALERSEGRDALMVNLSSQDLASAPSFSEERWPQIADSNFRDAMNQVQTLIILVTQPASGATARSDGGEVLGMQGGVDQQSMPGVQGRSPLQDPGMQQSQQYQQGQNPQNQGNIPQSQLDSLNQQQQRARQDAQQQLRDRDAQQMQQRVERAAQQGQTAQSAAGATQSQFDARVAQPGTAAQAGQPQIQSAPTPTIDARPFNDESFKRLDRDGDGRISKEEARLDPTFFAAWNKLDTNDNGFVTLTDVQFYRQHNNLQ